MLQFKSLRAGTYGVIRAFDANCANNLCGNGSSSLPVAPSRHPPGFTNSATVSSSSIPTGGWVTVSASIVTTKMARVRGGLALKVIPAFRQEGRRVSTTVPSMITIIEVEEVTCAQA
jgi:hypothetical protein